MIRLTLLWFFVAGLAIYAWKDWYKSLCGLILLLAVLEHPDMPKTLFGVQGLNPWNLLLVVILLAFSAQRRRERLAWDMPPSMSLLLLVYLGVVLVGFFRMMADKQGLEEYTNGYLVSEYLINTVKWVIPGLLLFCGCRSRHRFIMGLLALLSAHFLLSLQVIKWMAPSVSALGETFTARTGKILGHEIGYHRGNLAMVLAGGAWAIFATRPLAKRRSHAMAIIVAGLTVVFAQALTGGRMGYVTWAIVGAILCIVRWRKSLLFVPLIAIAMTWAVPAAVERMFQGFGGPDPDLYRITSGRNIAWPYVIEKIGDSPVFGFGRLAMKRTGLAAFLWEEFRENFPHPHNAYLELVLDNGWVGFLLVFAFYLVVLARGISLFRDSRSPLFVTIGGVACSLVLALLVASLGSQTFYPREGSVGMWCAIGLMLRVTLERSRAVALTRHFDPQHRSEGESLRTHEDSGFQLAASRVRLRSILLTERVPFPDSIDKMLWERPA